MRKINSILKKAYLRFQYLIRDKKRKSVYFCSFSGQYSDSPRAISEAIHQLDTSIDLIWRIKNGVDVPDYVTKVYSKREAKIAQVQADAWVLNTNSDPDNGDFKGKGTFFVATWHGDRGFKRTGWAAEDIMGSHYRGHKRLPNLCDVDLYTAASDYGVMQAHDGFHYLGEIQKIGLPRNDKLVNKDKYIDYASTIKKALNIEEGTLILLFAPTFRDNQHTVQTFDVDLERVINKLEKKGSRWKCLVRAHRSSLGLGLDINEKMVDVTDFGDMADLLLITDLLLTDYSSCSGDFILTGKPCILTMFDLSEYATDSRPFWVHPEETGFLIAKNQEELDCLIDNLDKYDHNAIAKSILKFYGTVESGVSSKVTAERIVGWINERHK